MTSAITAITDAWTAVSTWYITTFKSVPALFYEAETGLTFVGVLAVMGAGLAIIMGLVMVIRSFLKAH